MDFRTFVTKIQNLKTHFDSKLEKKINRAITEQCVLVVHITFRIFWIFWSVNFPCHSCAVHFIRRIPQYTVKINCVTPY